MGHCGGPAAEAGSAGPRRGTLHLSAFSAVPRDCFLALLLEVPLRRTPADCKYNHCAKVNGPLDLRSDIASAPLCVTSAGPQPLSSSCSPSFLSLYRSALSWILLTPLWVPLSTRCYGIAVWFLQEYTNRNRAGHCSRCGWAGIMAALWKTAAVDAVVL